MIGAPLDAGVLAAGFAGTDQSESTPGKLIRLWQRRVFQLAVSDHILDELERTLAKPSFQRRLTPIQAEEAVRLLRAIDDRSRSVSVVGCEW